MYELTSPSVTVVRRSCAAGFSPTAVIAAIFCFSEVASRCEARTSASALAPRQTTAQTAARPLTPSFYSLRPVGLPRPGDYLGHAAVHILLEHPEPDLLANVEEPVDLVVSLADVAVRALFDVAQRLQPVLQLGLAHLRIGDMLAQFEQQPVVLLRRHPARVVELLVLRQELRQLVLGDLHLLLRLGDRVGVERLPDLRHRDRLLAGFGGRSLRLSLARRRFLSARRHGHGRHGQAHDHRDQTSAHRINLLVGDRWCNSRSTSSGRVPLTWAKELMSPATPLPTKVSQSWTVARPEARFRCADARASADRLRRTSADRRAIRARGSSARRPRWRNSAPLRCRRSAAAGRPPRMRRGSNRRRQCCRYNRSERPA